MDLPFYFYGNYDTKLTFLVLVSDSNNYPLFYYINVKI